MKKKKRESKRRFKRRRNKKKKRPLRKKEKYRKQFSEKRKLRKKREFKRKKRKESSKRLGEGKSLRLELRNTFRELKLSITYLLKLSLARTLGPLCQELCSRMPRKLPMTFTSSDSDSEEHT